MRKFIAVLIAVVALFVCSVSSAECWEIDATVFAVLPFDSETVEIVVIADDGELYSYYDSSIIVGRVHLMFYNDEIIDVVSYDALNLPF